MVKAVPNTSGESIPIISMSKLLSLASPYEKILLGFGIITGLASACSYPLFAIVFGNVMDSFSPTGDIFAEVKKNLCVDVVSCNWNVWCNIH